MIAASAAQLAALGAVNIEVTDMKAGQGDVHCVICIMNKGCFLVEPCGHLGICGRCATTHRTTVRHEDLGRPNLIGCPVCRVPVEGYRRVFIN